MASFTVDYDGLSWLLVPTEFPTITGESAREWAAREAAARRDRGITETTASGTLEDYFAGIVAAAQSVNVDYDAIWAFLPDEAVGSLMVGFGAQDAEGDLDEFIGELVARRDNEYEPAQVSPMDLPNLGQGVRIVRHDLDEQRKFYVDVQYVFRRHGVDFMASTQSYDLATVAQALPSLDELVAGVHLQDEPV